jgi:predicted Zn-dependent peptidase
MADGLPPAHVVMHNARVDAVSAEAVRAAAERYLSTDEARIIVVGDAARIVEGLRTLGIADVSVKH